MQIMSFDLPEFCRFQRDKKYKPEFCEKVIDWFREGQTIVEVAQNMGVSRTMYYKWKETYPEFKEAAEFGEEAAEAYFARIGRWAMLGFPEPWMKELYQDFNTAIYCFKMKTRFRWRETGDADTDPHSVSKAQPLEITFSVKNPVNEIEITNSMAQQQEKGIVAVADED